MKKTVKAIVCKVGLDNHDKGARYVATVLRDAGMEVIYLGRFLTPEKVVRAAMDEDVDLIGISFLSAEYGYYVPQIMEQLKENNLEHVVVIVGGLIFGHDIEKLKELGVKEVFTPGTTSREITGFIVNEFSC